MTAKEISTLCAEYSNTPREDVKSINQGILRIVAKDFYNWLSDRYCIVSKDYIRAYHQGHANVIKMLESEPKTGERMMRQATLQLRIDTLKTLFGEDLFTDKTEKQCP